MGRWLVAVVMAGVLGFGLGKLVSVSVGAQPPLMLQGSDSATNRGVTIQTDGSNALKVIGK